MNVILLKMKLIISYLSNQVKILKVYVCDDILIFDLIIVSIQTSIKFLIAMRSLKISRGKSRSLSRESSPSTEILHKGLKRKITYSQYVKVCPRLKLKVNHNQMLINESNHQSSLLQMNSQIEKLRQQCRVLNENNLELSLQIKKQTRIRQIYEKRIKHQDPVNIPFEKLIQIKLIFEVQKLQKQLADKIDNLQSYQNFSKYQKEQLQEEYLTCINRLCNILFCNQLQIQNNKSQLFQKYYKLSDQLSQMVFKKRQQKKKQNEIQQQIYQIEQVIKREQWLLNRDNECFKAFYQSSRMGGSTSRARMIEETEVQIKKIKDDIKNEELQMKGILNEKMKIKCSIISSIQELRQMLKVKKREGGCSSLRVVKW